MKSCQKSFEQLEKEKAISKWKTSKVRSYFQISQGSNLFICPLSSTCPKKNVFHKISLTIKFPAHLSRIFQVRDELCLAHEAFQFFRQSNQNHVEQIQIETKKIFPDRNTNLVMGEQIHHQPSSLSERRRVKTYMKCQPFKE